MNYIILATPNMAEAELKSYHLAGSSMQWKQLFYSGDHFACSQIILS